MKSRLAALFLILVSGCFSSAKLIEPETQPREEVGSAIIRTATPLLQGGYNLVTVKRIDGRPPPYWEHKLVVSPGVHELDIEVDLRKPAANTDLTYVTKALRTISIQTDPDRTYIIDAQDDQRGLWIWISDEETGVVVAGEAPPEKLRR